MAVHISEQTWADTADVANRSITKLMEFIILNEALFDGLTELWAFHGNVDQAVADQLFGGSATQEELNKALDLKAAMTAAHNIHESTADMKAMRQIADVGPGRK